MGARGGGQQIDRNRREERQDKERSKPKGGVDLGEQQGAIVVLIQARERKQDGTNNGRDELRILAVEHVLEQPSSLNCMTATDGQTSGCGEPPAEASLNAPAGTNPLQLPE